MISADKDQRTEAKTGQLCCFASIAFPAICRKWWSKSAQVGFMRSEHCAELYLKKILLMVTLLFSDWTYGNWEGNFAFVLWLI